MMKKMFFIVITSIIFSNCKAQIINNDNTVFTQYCKEAMESKNILLLDFGEVDSLRYSTPDFGILGLKETNFGIELENKKILRETSAHQEIETPFVTRRETLFI